MARKHVRRFVSEFYSHWLSAWGGTVSLLIAVVLWVVHARGLSWGGFALFAGICFFIAAFQTWKKEHVKRQEEIEKRGRPEVILIYQPSHPRESSFLVRALTPVPALNVTIPDFLFEDGNGKVSFGIISLLTDSAPERIPYSVTRRKSRLNLTLEEVVGLLCLPNELEKTIDLVVHYNDSAGTEWESKNQFYWRRLIKEGQCFPRGFQRHKAMPQAPPVAR